jgi:hypothetical protein
VVVGRLYEKRAAIDNIHHTTYRELCNLASFPDQQKLRKEASGEWLKR